MLDPKELEKRIVAALPGADVEVRDLTGICEDCRRELRPIGV